MAGFDWRALELDHLRYGLPGQWNFHFSKCSSIQVMVMSRFFLFYVREVGWRWRNLIPGIIRGQNFSPVHMLLLHMLFSSVVSEEQLTILVSTDEGQFRLALQLQGHKLNKCEWELRVLFV